MTTLREIKVQAIRDALAEGNCTQDDLACRFEVSTHTIRKVVNGTTWRNT